MRRIPRHPKESQSTLRRIPGSNRSSNIHKESQGIGILKDSQKILKDSQRFSKIFKDPQRISGSNRSSNIHKESQGIGILKDSQKILKDSQGIGILNDSQRWRLSLRLKSCNKSSRENRRESQRILKDRKWIRPRLCNYQPNPLGGMQGMQMIPI